MHPTQRDYRCTRLRLKGRPRCGTIEPFPGESTRLHSIFGVLNKTPTLLSDVSIKYSIEVVIGSNSFLEDILSDYRNAKAVIEQPDDVSEQSRKENAREKTDDML